MTTTKRKLTTLILSIIMALALCIGFVPMFSMTAFATEDPEARWAESTDAMAFYSGTLAEAVAAANAADSTVGFIALRSSVELTETAAFNPVQPLTLDINNLTLSAAATVSPVISVTGGNVTITDNIGNGSITATGGNVFAVSGGTLTLSGGAYSAAAGSAVISYSGGSIVITGTMNDAVTISFATAVDNVSTVVTVPDGWALHGADGQEVSGSVTQGTTLIACAKVSEIASGTCGASGNEENVTWKITGNDAVGYTLTISGTGAVADYSGYGTDLPWVLYESDITSVVIGEGVTHIGDYAFAYYSALKTVSLPNGLESFGTAVFRDCSALESITIPDSVTAISDHCFQSCSKLETIHIGSGVASIGSYVFMDCTSLTGFTVSESNAHYKAVDGVLFSKDGKTLLAYPLAKAGKYEIPADVTTIPNLALSGCTSLTELTVAEGNNSYYAVDGVLYEEYGGTTVLIVCPGGKTGAVTVPEGVETISAYAFYGCTALTTVTFHSAPQTIGSYAFYDCTGLTTLNLYAVPNFNFEDYGTFYGCTLSNITVNLMCNAEDSVAATFTNAGFKEANKSLHADSDNDGLCDGCRMNLHTHVWSYSASGNVITAKCEGKVGTCPVGTVTITLKAPTSLTYDGSAKVVTVEQYPASVFTDVLDVAYTGDRTNVSADGFTATLTYGGETATLTCKITPAEVTVTADTKSKKYGEDNPVLTYKVSGLIGEDTLSGSLATVAAKMSNVGEYDITIGDLANSNYTISYTGAKLTITKVESSYTLPDDFYDDLVFNGSEQELITAVTAIGGEMQYKLGDDGTWGTEIPKGYNAGNYKVFYRVVGDSNHEDDPGGSVVVIIKQAAAPTVTIGKQSFVRTKETFGNTVDIADFLPSDRGETACANLSLSGVEGIVSEYGTYLDPGGRLGFATERSETAKSGKITLVVIMENYANTTVEVEVELFDPINLIITTQNQNITEGNALDQTKFSTSNLMNGHTVTVTISKNNGAAVASGATVKDASGKDVTDNYVMTYVNTGIYHEFANAWTRSDTHHWHVCLVDGCTEKGAYAACDGGDATCTALAICSTCQDPYGELDADDHTFGEWTVTKEPTEEEAGARTKTCACGHSVTEEIPMLEKQGLSGVAIAGIAMGSAAAAALGGFSLFWFVIKKKKWSDLIAVFKK